MNELLQKIIDKINEIEDDEEKMDGWDAWVELKEFITELKNEADM